MRTELRAGVAIYNAGEYHAAHDAWEDRWLDLETGTDDERLLHGLIQFTAVLYHARGNNWEGLAGLVASAREYLADLPPNYRDANVDEVRIYLDALHADPEHVERSSPPALTHEGELLELDDLRFETAAVAAKVFAEERARFEEAPIERAIEYARADLEDDTGDSPFVALVMDFATGEGGRDLVYQRLRQHVDRRTSEEADVEGLFGGDR